MKSRIHSRAFTLIELLVVIAIVAVLAVTVILTLNPAQLLRQARDSNRTQDLATLKSAISLYLADVASPSLVELVIETTSWPSMSSVPPLLSSGSSLPAISSSSSSSSSSPASTTAPAATGA